MYKPCELNLRANYMHIKQLQLITSLLLTKGWGQFLGHLIEVL